MIRRDITYGFVKANLHGTCIGGGGQVDDSPPEMAITDVLTIVESNVGLSVDLFAPAGE